MIQAIIDHKGVILALLFAISEALALIPSIKANSIFQLIMGLLQKAQAPEAPKA